MSEYSRRQFLHNSLLTAAASAAAAGSAGSLLAAEDASSSKEKSPNEKLNFAVMGVRGQGDSHIGSLLGKRNRGDVNIVAICDVDEKVGNARCDKIEKETGSRPKFYQDVRKMLEDKSIDCVSMATPNHWHALGAIWAMQAGKHVYVEKPASHNISEGRRMVEAARKYNRICQTGTQSRSQPGTIEAMKFIKDGGIGEVNLARGICFKERMSIGPKGSYDIPANIDYDLWCGPAPKREKSPYKGVKAGPVHYDWHYFWDFGCGDLGNQGVHEMDVARWGLGVDQLANGVITYGGRLGYEDSGETPNTEVAVLDYGPKTLVFEMHGLTYVPFKPLKNVKIGIVFEGTDGYVAMTSYSKGAAFDKDGQHMRTFSGGADHHANFIDAIRSGKKEDLNCDILEGHLSAGLCHMANISYRLGQKVTTDEVIDRLKAVKMSDDFQATLDRTIEHLADNGVKLDGNTKFQCGEYLKFDPKTETFPGNAAANELCSRDYRAPFVVPSAGKV